MARVAVILAVILSLFVLSRARFSPEPTIPPAAAVAVAVATSSETSADADPEPSETLDPTVHVYPINQIGDGALPAGDVLRHIDFSLRRPIYHHRHHFRRFHGHRRHRMRPMEIALGADAIGLPGDRIPLRSSEEEGLVMEEEIKGKKPTEEEEEEEEIEKREGDSDSDSDSDDDEEEKMERMEKRKRKCKKNKKHHHLRRFRHHHHRRHEQDEAEKIGFMKRFWDFLNRF